MSDAPFFAGRTLRQLEAEHPGHDIVVYRNHVVRDEEFPRGIECLVLIPMGPHRGGWQPFWRHGETIDVREPRQ